MLGRLLRIAALAAVTVFVVASFVDVDEPWFAIWVALLGFAAVVPSLAGGGRREGGSGKFALPSVPLHYYFLAIFCAVWVFAVNSYYVEIQRQRSERFDVVGVHLTPPRSGVLRIGASDLSSEGSVADSLDVRLEPPEDAAQRWSITIRRDAARHGFVLDSMEGVESLQQKRDWDRSRWRRLWESVVRFDPAWVQLWGDELSPSSPEVNALPARGYGLTQYFRLVESGDGRFLEWTTTPGTEPARARLVLPDTSPMMEVLRRRLNRRLGEGLPLRDLMWSRVPDSSAARDLVLTLVYEPQARLKPLERWGLLPPLLFRMASRDGEWIVTKSPQRSAERPFLSLGDTVRVVSHGRRWAFVLAEHARGVNRDAGVAVRFVRGPDPRLGWLPSNEVCGSQRRCTLVSTSRLPPSVPHFYIGTFGLDTSRYAFLGRVRMVGDRSAQIVASDTVYDAPVDSVVTVWARAAEPRHTAGYLLRIHKVATGELVNLNLTFGGLALLLLGAFVVLGADQRVRGFALGNGPTSTAAWTTANLALVFLGVRLVLGYRITYATPYYERGADSAIGAWIATILVVAFLLTWRGWAPRIVRLLLRAEDRFARWLAGQPSQPATGYTQLVTAASFGLRDMRRNRTGLLVAAAGLALLTWLRATAVGGALLVVFVGLLAWIAVEYLRPQRREGLPASTPAEVLRADIVDDDWARRAAIVIAACGLPLSVIARQLAVFVTLTLLVVYVVALVLLRVFRWGKREQGGRRREGKTAEAGRPPSTSASSSSLLPPPSSRRLGAPLVTLFLLAGLNCVVLVRRLDGPTLLFAALFFLFLLIVRTGRDAGLSFATGRGGAALVVLGIPLLATILSTRADFGLGLVFSLPLVVTLLLAVGLTSIPRRVALAFGGVVVLILVLAEPVLRPHLGRLESAQTAQARSLALDDIGGPLRHWSLTADPVTRAVVRGLAASRPELLERVLVSAAPSPAREEILRSLEQAWGGRAYAASGYFGEGLAGPTVIGRGVPVPISYAENTFSVYVLSEHGLLGGSAVLLLYVWLVLTVVLLLLRTRKSDKPTTAPWSATSAWQAATTDDISLAVVVGAALMLTIPAAYVAASNLGIVPLTGQNMPFLGLNAWSDVTFVSAMVSAMIAMLFSGGRREGGGGRREGNSPETFSQSTGKATS
jgi:cell division protein FtsW (lipid II flippase)